MSKTVITVICSPGTKVLTLSPEDPCPSNFKMTPATIELLEKTDLENASLITPSEASQLFSIGFTSVLFCWLAAKGIGILVNAMR